MGAGDPALKAGVAGSSDFPGFVVLVGGLPIAAKFAGKTMMHARL